MAVKPASFVVWSGDPFGLMNAVLRVYIDGEETWRKP